MARPKGSNVRSQGEFASGMRGATSSRYAEERRKALERAKAAREAEKSRSYKGEEKGILRDSEGKAVLSGYGSTIKTGGEEDLYKAGGKVMRSDMEKQTKYRKGGMCKSKKGYAAGGKVRGNGCCARTKKCKMR